MTSPNISPLLDTSASPRHPNDILTSLPLRRNDSSALFNWSNVDKSNSILAVHIAAATGPELPSQSNVTDFRVGRVFLMPFSSSYKSKPACLLIEPSPIIIIEEQINLPNALLPVVATETKQ